jgi:hypothetical protein
MPTPTDLGAMTGRLVGRVYRPGGLAYSVGKRQQIILGRGQACRVRCEPDHFPTAGDAELVGV